MLLLLTLAAVHVSSATLTTSGARHPTAAVVVLALTARFARGLVQDVRPKSIACRWVEVVHFSLGAV